ncbi:MAG TPA: protocatechuate 3,4-dioxygenase subunit alpha [Candidatus Eisenbacteria bacterium]|nr:protocatechuate 3,4-dioxygenase subunit alpha [Candidatus Eisenbacteria bacterium]
MTLQATTWQTVGPFFSIGLCRLYRDNLAGPGVAGERVEINGRILDGDGKPVPDGVIEIWQANSQGKYAHPEDVQDKPLEKEFTGFGRIATDIDGYFRFSTIKPGRVPGPVGPNGKANLQAPHLAISILTRGLLRRLVTRMYFPDDPSNAEDFVLSLVEESRRSTLIAKKVEGRAGSLEWDVVLQGANETVFFEL